MQPVVTLAAPSVRVYSHHIDVVTSNIRASDIPFRCSLLESLLGPYVRPM